MKEIVVQSVETQMVASDEDERSSLRSRPEFDSDVFQRAQSQLAAVLKRNNNISTAPSDPWPAARTESYPVLQRRTSSKAQNRQNRASNGNHGASAKVKVETSDSLAEACRLAAESLGVTLRIPPELSQSMPMLQRLQRLLDFSCLHSRKVLLRDEWWRHDNGSMVGFLIGGSEGSATGKPDELPHPVALLPVSANSYRLLDPQTGTNVLIDKRTEGRLDRTAFMLYPAAIAPLPYAKDLLGPAIQRHWRDLLLILLMAVAGGLLNMLMPIITGVIYGSVIPSGYQPELAQLAFGLCAAAFGACAFQITRALSVLRLTGKLDLHLQSIVWGRLLALPASFFRRFRVGDLADRVRGIRTIRQLLFADVTTTALALITTITSFGLLFYYSWRLALLASCLVVFLIAATTMLSLLQVRYLRRSVDLQGRLSSLTFSLVQAISKLRSSGAEIRSYGIWAKQFAERSHYALKAQRVVALQASLNAFYIVGSELTLFAVMGSGLRKRLSLSDFLAFSAAFGQVQAALLTFITLIPDLLSILPLYKRLEPILVERAEIEGDQQAVELLGGIEVTNVSFRYHKAGSPVIDSVSFKARPGQFVAIVGPSGSGKSTLIRLLLGFESPDSGCIHYDGRDLASIDLKCLRRQIGTVLQNSKPITGDIFTNIVGSTSGNLEAAWEAARIAGIDEEIRSMPMGMHTMIGEGATTFSGGEQQRLMIARAVVNRPGIILFDEATSALDNPTQDNVQRCLEHLSATRIVVAHRLSTIRHADRIYVLNNGRIVEEGNYQELWERGGYFAEMAQRQMY